MSNNNLCCKSSVLHKTTRFSVYEVCSMDKHRGCKNKESYFGFWTEFISIYARTGKRVTLQDYECKWRGFFLVTVVCNYQTKDRDAGMGFRVAKSFDLWWHPQNTNQSGLWESTLTLSEEFFEEIIKSPVPIDIRALKALKRSPLALDLYIT